MAELVPIKPRGLLIGRLGVAQLAEGWGKYTVTKDPQKFERGGAELFLVLTGAQGLFHPRRHTETCALRSYFRSVKQSWKEQRNDIIVLIQAFSCPT